MSKVVEFPGYILEIKQCLEVLTDILSSDEVIANNYDTYHQLRKAGRELLLAYDAVSGEERRRQLNKDVGSMSICSVAGDPSRDLAFERACEKVHEDIHKEDRSVELALLEAQQEVLNRIFKLKS